MLNKSLNHGGHGRPVTNWCNPYTAPPKNLADNIKHGDDRNVFAHEFNHNYINTWN